MIGFSIIIGLTLLIIGLSITASQIANKSIDIVKNLRVPIVQITTEARSNLLKMMTNVRGHLVLNEESYIETYRQNKQVFDTNLAEIEALSKNSPDREYIERINQLKTDFDEWLEIVERLFILRDSPRENQPALRLAHLEIQPLYVSAHNDLNGIIEIQRKYSESEKDYTLLMEVNEIHTSFDKMIMSLRAFATTGDATLKYAYALNEVKNTAIIKKMTKKQVVFNDKQQINFDHFIKIRKQIIIVAAQIHEIIGGEQAFKSLYLFRTKVLPKAQRMLLILDNMTAEHQAQLQTELDQGRQRLSKVQVQIILGGLVSLLFGIGLIFFFSRIIANPIQRLTHTAEQIADGHLNVTAPVESEDEIGRLSRTINYMARQLQKDSIQAKDALKESETRFKKMIEQSPMPMVITDENQDITFFNDKFTELFGYTLEDIKTAEEWWETAYPDKIYRFKVRQSWMVAVEEATAHNTDIKMQEWDITIKDGTKRSCEFFMVPFEDVGFIVINDITKRRQTEEELKKFAQRLSIHVEQTPLGVIEWDLNFKVTQWNNAAQNIFGYSKKEAIGQTGLELVVPNEVHNLVQAIWDDLVSGKGGARSTNENVTKDGKSIICEWYNTTLSDSNGIVVGVASLIQDITDQINFEKEKTILEKQLQQSQKMEAIGTLAGGIAHDFNNILSIILGYSDILKTGHSLDASVDGSLDEIIKAGNRAKDLVSQILAFSRQNKKEFIHIQPDLIIKEALKMLRASIPTTIKIESSVPKSGSIIGDPTQLHQIMMNLCTNSYHAMRETGGMLRVLLEPIRLEENDIKILSLPLPPGPYVKLEVSDNGHGMDKVTQQKIFDPYFTTKKIGEGTGLGLSVVHGIVKHFGGHISIYSEPDKGTTFRIYLPQITTDAETTLNRPKEPNLTGDEHILVVDDERSIVEMEKFMLEGLGYQVSTCMSSPEALKIFQNQPEDIALVITDMTMPDMTGIELIKSIRSIRSNIPVILCSGFSELINDEKANYIDNLKYLKKPVLKRDFALTIREMLDNDNKT